MKCIDINPQINREDFDDIDEHLFLDLLELHRIISLTSRATADIEKFSLKAQLSQLSAKNKLNQLKLSAELIRIVQLFNKVNIRTIALKGPVLSQLIYLDIGMRSSKDLDLFIDVNDFDKAIDMLMGNGYQLQTFFKTKKQKDAILKYYHHVALYHSANDVILELHWKLTPISIKANTIRSVEDVRAVVIGEESLNSLGNKDLIQYLCVHGVFHSFFRLQWLSDLHHLLNQLSVEDLNETYKSLKSNDNELFLLVTLKLLQEVFNVQLSDEHRNDILVNKRVGKLVRIAVQKINENTKNDVRPTSIRGRLERLILNHRIQYYTGGMKSLVSNIIARNVRPSNWKIFAFPDWIFWMNHLFSRVIWLFGSNKSIRE